MTKFKLIFLIIGIFYLTGCNSSSSGVIDIGKYVSEDIEIPGGHFKINGIEYSFTNETLVVEKWRDKYHWSSATHEIGDTIIKVEKCDPDLQKIELPSEMMYKGKIYPVAEIASNVFLHCEKLSSLILPEGLKELEGGFSSPYLTSITIPGSVYSIHLRAPNLKEIKLEDGIVVVGIGSDSLINFDLPASVRSLDEVSCPNMQSIKLNEGLEMIGYRCFENDSLLKSINIPNSVNNMEGEIFRGCTSLETVKLSSNVNILKDTFEGCTALKSIKIPEGVRILKGTFEDCVTLEEVQLPSSLKEIEYSTFRNCKSLSKINFPDNLEKIGRYAFENCSSLKSITLSKKVNYIGEEAFYGCDEVESVTVLNPNPFPERLAFGKYALDCPLYVTEGSVNAYIEDNEGIGYYFKDRIYPIKNR